MICHALRSLIFVLPIMYLYYDIQKGVSVQGLYLVESTFSLGVLLATIPAGYLSDVWKRVRVFSVGAFLIAAGFTIEFFGYGLYQMALGEFLVGLGFAFSGSTAISAIAYDTLLDEGNEKVHLTLQSNLQIIQVTGNFVAMIIGAYLYTYNPDLPIAIMAVLCAISGVLSLFMDEPNRSKKPAGKTIGQAVVELLSVAKYALFERKDIACIIFLLVVVMTTTKLGYWTHQPFFKELHIEDHYFGWLMAAGSLTGILGAQLAKYEGKIKPLYSILFLLVTPVICYGIAGLAVNYVSFALITVVGAVYNYADPVIKHAINGRISSERRATILGVKYFFYHLAFMSTAWAVGYTAEVNTPSFAMVAIAVSCGVLGIFVFICLRKHKVI